MNNDKQRVGFFSTVLTLPREAWLGFSASLVQAYNSCVFMFMVPYLAPKFFPEMILGEAMARLYELAMIGMFFYPFGALLYGYIGDKLGRKIACTTSTLGLALVTGCKGLFPIEFGPQSIFLGFLALNSIQNFFAGGEYRSAIIYSLEHASGKRQGGLSGLSCLFAVAGLFLAQGVSYWSSIDASGLVWRAAFIAGAIAGTALFILRAYCAESPQFVAARSERALGEGSLIGFVRDNWLSIALVTTVGGFFMTVYSYIFYFLPAAWGTQIEPDVLNTYILVGLVTYGAVLLLAGMLSDHWGVKPVMALGAAIILFGSIPLVALGSSYAFWTIEILTVGACLFIGPMHSFFFRAFPVETRCRGVMTSDALSFALFAAPVVPVCIKVASLLGGTPWAGIVPTVTAALALFGLWRVRLDRRKVKTDILCVPDQPES